MIPLVTLAIYLSVVMYGPRMMKKRPAFRLQGVLVAYNFSLVIMSAYMVYELLVSSIEAGYSLTCQVVDYSYTPNALRMLFVCWLYYVSKYVELADTVFFILRKKSNQVSVLHVYHHAATVFFAWLGVAYVPGGQSFFQPLLNSAVHVVMYTYYGLAALGPHIQPYLWWKKYLTSMQLVQLTLIMGHAGYNMFVPDCAFPKGYDLLVFSYALSLLLLFANFYRQAYSTGKRQEFKGKPLASNGVQDNGVHSHKDHRE
nr:hypothetical protein BaRGS_020454 [Batillaria attramentaria]